MFAVQSNKEYHYYQNDVTELQSPLTCSLQHGTFEVSQNWLKKTHYQVSWSVNIR